MLDVAAVFSYAHDIGAPIVARNGSHDDTDDGLPSLNRLFTKYKHISEAEGPGVKSRTAAQSNDQVLDDDLLGSRGSSHGRCAEFQGRALNPCQPHCR
jgi:hypothetical protein